jgi:hypothetical protein
VETRAGWSEKELLDEVKRADMRIIDGPLKRDLPDAFSDVIRTQYYAYCVPAVL